MSEEGLKKYFEHRVVTSGGDSCTASLSIKDSSVGYLGFFSGQSRELIREGTHWLRSRGVKSVIAPVDFTTWFRYRLRTDSNTARPSRPWEPDFNPDLKRLLEEENFQVCEVQETRAWEIPHGIDALSGTRSALRCLTRLEKQRYTFKAFETDQLSQDYLKIIHELTIQALSPIVDLDPLPFSAFLETIPEKNMGRTTLAFSRYGTPAGYLYSFLDQGTLVFKTIMVPPHFQQKGISPALLAIVTREASLAGIRSYASALVRQSAATGSLVKAESADPLLKWTAQYKIWRKLLK